MKRLLYCHECLKSKACKRKKKGWYLYSTDLEECINLEKVSYCGFDCLRMKRRKNKNINRIIAQLICYQCTNYDKICPESECKLRGIDCLLCVHAKYTDTSIIGRSRIRQQKITLR